MEEKRCIAYEYNTYFLFRSFYNIQYNSLTESGSKQFLCIYLNIFIACLISHVSNTIQ